MLAQTIFRIALPLGYLAWGLCLVTYVWPRLVRMKLADAHRLIATFHSFRFFGLVFLLPGFVGPGLSPVFSVPAAYGDLATSLLAILALATFKIEKLYWPLVVAFNAAGLRDLMFDFWNAIRTDMPAHAGELGAAFAIPALFVPALIITHVFAFILLSRRSAAGSLNAVSQS
ncbi:hypothetical protein ACRAWG_06260 [Methylobacterium sp. P31]